MGGERQGQRARALAAAPRGSNNRLKWEAGGGAAPCRFDSGDPPPCGSGVRQRTMVNTPAVVAAAMMTSARVWASGWLGFGDGFEFLFSNFFHRNYFCLQWA